MFPAKSRCGRNRSRVGAVLRDLESTCFDKFDRDLAFPEFARFVHCGITLDRRFAVEVRPYSPTSRRFKRVRIDQVHREPELAAAEGKYLDLV